MVKETTDTQKKEIIKKEFESLSVAKKAESIKEMTEELVETEQKEIIKAIFESLSVAKKAELIREMTEKLVKTERDKIIKAMREDKNLSKVEGVKSVKKTGRGKRTIEIDGWTCKQTIKASGGKGRSVFICYKWITVECTCSKTGKNPRSSNYVICMNQQDFDMKKTGNAHVLIDGKIQIWRNLIQFDSAENGGSIRPLPIEVEEKGKEIVEIKEEYKDVWDVFEGEQPYKFYHAPNNAYPVARSDSTAVMK